MKAIRSCLTSTHSALGPLHQRTPGLDLSEMRKLCLRKARFPPCGSPSLRCVVVTMALILSSRSHQSSIVSSALYKRVSVSTEVWQAAASKSVHSQETLVSPHVCWRLERLLNHPQVRCGSLCMRREREEGSCKLFTYDRVTQQCVLAHRG